MKRKLLTALFLLSGISFSQRITINPESVPYEASPALSPGYFYNNTNTEANIIFESSGTHYNTLRTFDITFALRISTGMTDSLESLSDWQSTH